jgi:hypothetical protein
VGKSYEEIDKESNSNKNCKIINPGLNQWRFKG